MKSLWPNLEITEEYVPTCYHLIYDKGLSKHEVILGWSVMSTNRVSNAETLKILRIQMHKAGWHKRSEWKTRCTMQFCSWAHFSLCGFDTCGWILISWSVHMQMFSLNDMTFMLIHVATFEPFHIMRWEGMTSKKKRSRDSATRIIFFVIGFVTFDSVVKSLM